MHTTYVMYTFSRVSLQTSDKTMNRLAVLSLEVTMHPDVPYFTILLSNTSWFYSKGRVLVHSIKLQVHFQGIENSDACMQWKKAQKYERKVERRTWNSCKHTKVYHWVFPTGVGLARWLQQQLFMPIFASYIWNTESVFWPNFHLRQIFAQFFKS